MGSERNGLATNGDAPLIPEVGILALPYHDFGTNWMTPHHLMTRLAKYFHVVWLEMPIHWRALSERSTRIAMLARLQRRLPASFDVYLPELWLSDIYGAPEWFREHFQAVRVERGWRRLERRGCNVRVLHLWHHQFESALHLKRHDLSLYHIDDEYTFTEEPPPMPPAERRVLSAVDQVFAISPGLMERKGGINRNLRFAPEGVDYALYSTPVPEPADIAPIPHPRVGYSGRLKQQLNWRLLRDLAQRHSNWQFVYVGSRSAFDAECEAILQEMTRMSNVHFLGEKTVKDLAKYPQYFDACMMPYNINGYTNNIYPLKLHEYLASGKPVVGTPIRSLKDFTHVIALGETAEDWSAALTEALQPAAVTPERMKARQEVARGYDWGDLTFDVAKTVCERLGSGYTQRLKKLSAPTPTLTD